MSTVYNVCVEVFHCKSIEVSGYVLFSNSGAVVFVALSACCRCSIMTGKSQ